MSEQKQVSGAHGVATVEDGLAVQTQSFSFDQALILHELERTLAAVSAFDTAAFCILPRYKESLYQEI